MKSSKFIFCDEILASFSFWLDCSNIGKVHRPRFGKFGSKISFGIIRLCINLLGTKSDHCFAFSVPRSINQSLSFVKFRLFSQEHKYPGVEMGDTRKEGQWSYCRNKFIFRRYSKSKVYLLYCPPMQRATPLSGVGPLRPWVGGDSFRLPPRSDITDVTLFSEGDLAAEAEKVKLKTSPPFDLFERTRIFNVPFLSYKKRLFAPPNHCCERLQTSRRCMLGEEACAPTHSFERPTTQGGVAPCTFSQVGRYQFHWSIIYNPPHTI